MALSGDSVSKAVWSERVADSLKKIVGVEYAIPTVSGTAALHVALLACGIKNGEEVLVPSLTFAATANAITYCGAVPHFMDGKLAANPTKLHFYLSLHTIKNPNGPGRLNPKTGRVISALIVVDLLGFPADWEKIEKVADNFGLTLIEDAAQALGSSLGNRKCGSFGRAAILSFNNNKIVTGNGGGAVLTDDDWVAAKAISLSTTARDPHPWFVQNYDIAYNYRLPDINAALLSVQLNRLDSFLDAKKKLLKKYKDALAPHNQHISILQPEEPWQGVTNNWLITARLEDAGNQSDNRDKLFKELHKRGILARALFTPLHTSPMYGNHPRNPNMAYCEDTFSRLVCLPSGVDLA